MKQKCISIDFDDTLFSLSEEKVGMLWAASNVLVPIQKVHDLVFEKHKEGFVIDIVTAREKWDIEEVERYVEAYELPIRKIHHTGGKFPKSTILKKIESMLHVDDMVNVVVDCKMNGIPVLLVDDGRHRNNSTAKEFQRIFV